MSGLADDGRMADPLQQPRKVRLHKVRPQADPASTGPTAAERNAFIDRKIAELIPGIADLSLSPDAAASAHDAAAAVRAAKLAREERARETSRELANIFNPIPGSSSSSLAPGSGAVAAAAAAAQAASEPWVPKARPTPRKIQLSQYQYEMINYQRMLMRKNIWYYRDRMNVPRGPCPLHVLKDCWVQGIIDENTFVWGHGLYDWLPAKNVKLLLPMIRTPEVQFGAWIKRTFSLKPALNRIRELRKDERPVLNPQVELMR